MPKSANLLVGLTGGMGCGKSTAAAFFAERGFNRLDSDAIVRDQILTNPQVIKAIRSRLGDDLVDSDGSLNRGRLATRVFADPAALTWLEGEVHPRVYDHWRQAFAAASGQRFIVEVPLLFEKSLENWFDFTVCVTTESQLQLRRLEQRGISPELAQQRLAKQMPLARKCELADYVLLNDGSPAFLREQINALADRLLN